MECSFGNIGPVVSRALWYVRIAIQSGALSEWKKRTKEYALWDTDLFSLPSDRFWGEESLGHICGMEDLLLCLTSDHSWQFLGALGLNHVQDKDLAQYYISPAPFPTPVLSGPPKQCSRDPALLLVMLGLSVTRMVHCQSLAVWPQYHLVVQRRRAEFCSAGDPILDFMPVL